MDRTEPGPGKGHPTDAALASQELMIQCISCGETKPGKKFPTIGRLAHRPETFPREHECRECQKKRRGRK